MITAQIGYRRNVPEVPFAFPTGDVPVALRDLRTVSTSEAKKYQQEADEALTTFLIREQIYGLMGQALRDAQGFHQSLPGAMRGSSSGTYCKGLLCTDFTSDDPA